MAGHRFLPLIVAVVLGTVVLIARLYQVQIVEGQIWAQEAANLVRSGAVRPYRRGAILDARGRALAHDETVYRVQFNYREFRRGHPLGLVAHARSALLGRPVGLAETLENLPQWTAELIELSAGELDAFGRGEALQLGRTILPASTSPGRDDRSARRNDVRFYVAQLFELEPGEARDFSKSFKAEPDAPLCELAARARRMADADELRQRLSARLVECSTDLEQLALRIRLERAPELATDSPGAALDALVASIEERRTAVEDDCASALFAEAFGFSAGRIEPTTLHDAVDLSWIASILAWDDARLAAWLERARGKLRESLFGGQIERLATELEVESDDALLPRHVLQRWAELFAARRARVALEGLTAARELVVLADLDALFTARADEPREYDALLSFQDPRWADERAALGWRELAAIELGESASESEVEAAAEQWRAAFSDGFDGKFLRERTRGVVARWEQELQRALRAELDARRPAAVRGARAQLELVENRLDRASERARYILKDRGSRPETVARDPEYATVHLLTRHKRRFAGFRVEDTSERVVARDERGVQLAGELVGRVGGMDLRETLLESGLRAEFEALRRQSSRTADEEAELRWMARRLVRDDELHGRSGIEAYFDVELSGRNGYREVRGLQELIDGVYQVDVPPEDGADLTLTLDLDVQRAATDALASPEPDPDDAKNDYAWLARPTGAIVMLSVDGDVLAAASFPDFARGDELPRAPRDEPFERTLRKPTFQPPGSCFKPFVAAWALDHIGFDPAEREACAMLPDQRGAGYFDVRCNVHYGHGLVDLREALKVSCNAYFARLGERFALEDWRELAHEFGFGEPSGVRAFGARPGLLEDRFAGLFQRAPEGRSARLAGNGLAVVEATPMQLARATAGLCTGVLPQVRLVHKVGAVETPRRSRPLSLSSASLNFVREALLAVAQESGGSAHAALDERQLGFRVGAKTGSGDIGSTKTVGSDGRERVRKHTWLIGFFPYDAPRYVVVVFCNDTLATASHSAIWLAREFLTSPAVQELVRGGAK